MSRILLTLLLSCTAAACVATAGDTGPAPQGIAPPQRVPNPQLNDLPVGKPVSTSVIPRAIRRAVVADAAKRFRVAESAVVLARAEQVTWPDGSLGCPRPGEMYTQAQVPGFRLLAKTANGDLLYNTDAQSTVRNCPLAEGLAPAPADR